MKIQDLMSDKVVTITSHEPLKLAREVLRTCGISALPVVDQHGHPQGMLTATDLVEDAPEDAPVDSVMTAWVYAVKPDDEVILAVRIMLDHHVHHVPVTRAGRVVGMVSSFDVLKLIDPAPQDAAGELTDIQSELLERLIEHLAPNQSAP